MPAGLTVVPLADRPPSEIVVAWTKTGRGPLVDAFVQVAGTGYRP